MGKIAPETAMKMYDGVLATSDLFMLRDVGSTPNRYQLLRFTSNEHNNHDVWLIRTFQNKKKALFYWRMNHGSRSLHEGRVGQTG